MTLIARKRQGVNPSSDVDPSLASETPSSLNLVFSLLPLSLFNLSRYVWISVLSLTSGNYFSRWKRSRLLMEKRRGPRKNGGAFRTNGPVRSSFLRFEIYGSIVMVMARDATRRLLMAGYILPYGGETVEDRFQRVVNRGLALRFLERRRAARCFDNGVVNQRRGSCGRGAAEFRLPDAGDGPVVAPVVGLCTSASYDLVGRVPVAVTKVRFQSRLPCSVFKRRSGIVIAGRYDVWSGCTCGVNTVGTRTERKSLESNSWILKDSRLASWVSCVITMFVLWSNFRV